ncbi:MAG: HlyD family efflux transporter periplasmic adaptor subunit [Pseudonocardia sp.]
MDTQQRSPRAGLAVIGALVLLVAAAFVAAWVIDARSFVTTDNAQVDGDQIVINAPATGTLTGWTATLGTSVDRNQVLGRIEMDAGFAEIRRSVRSPGAGTIAQSSAVEGAFVTSGTRLAVAYDPAAIFVTARVAETEIDAVRVGQVVDVVVDAYDDVPLTGRVVEVQGAAAAVLAPRAGGSGDFQKVTQVIPVKVALDGTRGLALAPGMNVTAKIHRD